MSQQSKNALIAAFGEQVGTKLYGAAIKLSAQLHLGVDDVSQDLAEAALHIQRQYGFVHINTAVNHARNAIYRTYRYGVNQYFTRQGVREISIDDKGQDAGRINGDGTSTINWLDKQCFQLGLLKQEDREANLRVTFRATAATLNAKDRYVLHALGQSYKATEIAKALDCSCSAITNAKHRLRDALSWAVTND